MFHTPIDEIFFEINGNLKDKDAGLAGYNIFEQCVLKVKNIYDELFGKKILQRYPLYIDNATADSGYTPVTTPVLKKFIIIKLGIKPEDTKSTQSRIIYQFSHELMHFVFYCFLGIDKEKAGEQEEAICTASSLILLNHLHESDEFSAYLKYTENLPEKPDTNRWYRNGAQLARDLKFKYEALRGKVFEYCDMAVLDSKKKQDQGPIN